MRFHLIPFRSSSPSFVFCEGAQLLELDRKQRSLMVLSRLCGADLFRR